MSHSEYVSRAVRPLRQRLRILAAVAILPLALTAGAGLYFLSQHQSEQAQEVGLELARSVANAVDTELRGTVTILETLATAPSLDRNDTAAFRERATRIVGIQHSWAAIVVNHAAGTVALDTRTAPDASALPVADPPSMASVLQTRKPVVGSLVRHQGEWLYPIRVPVMREGELRHVITALVKPTAIRDVITRQQAPSDWVISIVDRHGLRVARSRAHGETLGGRLSESGQSVVSGGSREGFGVSYSLEGEKIYTPYSRIEPAGWTAVLGMPTSGVDSAAWRSVAVFGGGVVLSILIGTLAAGWVARGITRPIAELREAAEALGNRRLPESPQTSLAEVRDVGLALSTAAAQIARFAADRDELLEKERTAKESAERANRAKEEFMAVLSHELRTPLNAVYGWAKLLQSNQLKDEAVIAGAKAAIVRNADAQVRLIDDLLDLSRISSGKMRLSKQPVSIADPLQGALDAVRPSASDKGVHIAVAIEDAGCLVAADPARLQQIVWNLLVNAVKFTGSGGEVLLRQQRIDNHVEISVSDTGQGIAQEILPHVFERFRQADSSSTRSHGGLGLGLALVKHLTELHDGSVTAESAGAGRGSKFTVRLPLVAADAPAGSPIPFTVSPEDLSQVVRLDGLRVVVADDEPDSRSLTETILRGAGAEVRTCASAAEAVRLLGHFNADVLVSDLEMPGEDGYSLIRTIRGRQPAAIATIPAIALSAYGRPQDRLRAIEAGFTMHVPKPVDPRELTVIVAGVAGLVEPIARAGYGNMPSSM